MNQNGFTLIELMITVAILAIIATVALPSYQDSVQKTRRAAAQADLIELAAYMERLYTTTGSYNLSGALPDDNDFYSFSPTITASGAAFSIEADPTGTAQASDPCGKMTITNTGSQGAEGTDCW